MLAIGVHLRTIYIINMAFKINISKTDHTLNTYSM